MAFSCTLTSFVSHLLWEWMNDINSLSVNTQIQSDKKNSKSSHTSSETKKDNEEKHRLSQDVTRHLHFIV